MGICDCCSPNEPNSVGSSSYSKSECLLANERNPTLFRGVAVEDDTPEDETLEVERARLALEALLRVVRDVVAIRRIFC